MSISAIDRPTITGLLLIVLLGVVGLAVIAAQTVAKLRGRELPGSIWWVTPVGITAVACWSVHRVVGGTIGAIQQAMESMGAAGRIPREGVISLYTLGSVTGLTIGVLGISVAVAVALSVSANDADEPTPVDRLSAGFGISLAALFATVGTFTYVGGTRLLDHGVYHIGALPGAELAGLVAIAAVGAAATITVATVTGRPVFRGEAPSQSPLSKREAAGWIGAHITIVVLLGWATVNLARFNSVTAAL